MRTDSPTFADIEAAGRRIAPFVKKTPIWQSQALDQEFGASLFFKCENLQVAGSFKARGAHNAIFSLSDADARRGVATHSSGNHAAAVALAAQRRGISAWIVMPSDTVAIKCENVRSFGGEIIFCEPGLASREAAAGRILAETGASLIHPYNAPEVVAGQGTAALEFLEKVPDLDFLLLPVSGGGLLGGSALAARHLSPQTQIIGCEPAQADDAARSLRAGERLLDGKPDTIADGLRGALGDLNWSIIASEVDDIVTASEAGIIRAMRQLCESLKMLVEPSSAVPLAALRENLLGISGKKVGIILSGGNVDLDHLPWLQPASEDLAACAT